MTRPPHGMVPHRSGTHLGPGEFLGHATRDHRGDDLAIACRIATVPAGAVRRHDHEAAHLVFAPPGYVSSAHGARADRPALIFNPPDVRHRDHVARVPVPFLAITLTGRAWSELVDRGGVDGTPRACHAPHAHQLAGALADLAVHAPAAAARRPALLFDLAWQVLAFWVDPRAIDPSPIARARAMVLDDPRCARSSTELARRVGLHPVYLARGFRRDFGTTPSALARDLRLTAACRAVAAGAPPGQAALDHGFADQAHLTRWMVRRLGVTPGRLAPRRRTVPPG